MNKAFTIIEVLAAILVITIGVLAAYAVVQEIVSQTLESSSRLTAVYLAQEQIENVRNIRDTNWLGGEVWDNGLDIEDDLVFSKYQRTVTITPDGLDKVEVLIEIQWTEKGKIHAVSVQENLYDWF